MPITIALFKTFPFFLLTTLYANRIHFTLETPTILVGVHFRARVSGKAGLSEIFDCRTEKSNRKRPFLTHLKAAVYAASLPRPCSAPPPLSRNGMGLQ